MVSRAGRSAKATRRRVFLRRSNKAASAGKETCEASRKVLQMVEVSRLACVLRWNDKVSFQAARRFILRGRRTPRL